MVSVSANDSHYIILTADSYSPHGKCISVSANDSHYIILTADSYSPQGKCIG
jgi:hypothetical protein